MPFTDASPEPSELVTAGTGSAAPLSGSLIGGKDSNSNFQPLSVTTAGILNITGSVFSDVSFDGANGELLPLSGAVVGGSDGTNFRFIKTDVSGVVQVSENEEATFIVSATGSVIGNNKSMISLFNTGSSPVTLKIREIYIINVQTGAVTGIAAEFRLFRIAGISGGTTLTPLPFDTNDSIHAAITASTNTTVSGESGAPFYRWIWSSDDWGPGTLDQEGMEHTMQNTLPVYVHRPKIKPLTIRAGQGLHIKHVVNSTAGTFDLVVVFTQV